MNTVLKIENLSHRYTTNWAVRDINLEINQRGVIGLLGSNGAGKSTIMNIVCGVLKPTEGEISINGIDIRKYPAKAKSQLGFLPQFPPLYLDFTVDEYLIYAAQLRFIPNDRVRLAVNEAMEKCGIAHFKSRLIKNLSGGYRQRVGIAQAILHKPALVILDEPTNGLDPNQIIEARKLIREIAAEHTVLLSSHVLSEINILCRDIIMIESGRIVFSDSMDAFNNYVQPQTILVRLENMPTEADLLAIPGITKVQFLSEKQCRLYFDQNNDITEAVVAASMDHNWRLKEINYERSLLDDVFKQLSTQSQK